MAILWWMEAPVDTGWQLGRTVFSSPEMLRVRRWEVLLLIGGCVGGVGESVDVPPGGADGDGEGGALTAAGGSSRVAGGSECMVGELGPVGAVGAGRSAHGRVTLPS